ncbi:MAG: hypothetical protein ABW252_00835 [Polyangiales bacterium]
MKLEATLTIVATLIAIGFVLTRNAFLMGATVFVATPLWLVAISFYVRRVLKDLRSRELL